MRIDEIPDERTVNFPERMTIAISAEQRRALELVKIAKNKKPHVLVRELIDEFIEKNKEFFESAG